MQWAHSSTNESVPQKAHIGPRSSVFMNKRVAAWLGSVMERGQKGKMRASGVDTQTEKFTQARGTPTFRILLCAFLVAPKKKESMTLATQHIVDQCFAEAAHTLAMTNVQLVEVEFTADKAPQFAQDPQLFNRAAQLVASAYWAIGWQATNFDFSARLAANGRDVIPRISFVISPDQQPQEAPLQSQRQSVRRRRHTLGQGAGLAALGTKQVRQRPVAQGS